MKGPFLGNGCLLLITLLAAPALAADLPVPGQYSTIADALAAAQPGDRVVLDAGVYHEYGLVLPGGVTLTGASSDAAGTVIDAGGRGRVIEIHNQRQQVTLRNLTLTGGVASGATDFGSSGGAVLCNHSVMLIDNCVLTGNRADHNGGALWVLESSPTIFNSRFIGNTAGAGGGAIDCTLESSPSIRDSWFEDNAADWGGALSCRDWSSPTVTSSVFLRNSADGMISCGGGVFSDLDSQPNLALCTFSGNSADYGGGVANFAGAGAMLTRCTLVGNAASQHGAGLYSDNAAPVLTATIVAFQQGEGIYSSGLTAPLVQQSNLFGNAGGEWTGDAAPADLGASNMSADPVFCADEDDVEIEFRLDDTSPCHPDSNSGVTLGAWAAGCGTQAELNVAFEATWRDGQAVLSWQLPVGVDGAPLFRVTGALTSSLGDEWDVPFVESAAGTFTAEDTAGGGDSGQVVYRLYVSYDGQYWSLLDEMEISPVPSAPGLHGLAVWPNPFNPQTTVGFELGRAGRVRATVYDLTGRLVRVLAEGAYPSGHNELTWQGEDQTGGRVASGAYFVVVESADDRLTTKVMLLK
jgi:hypothetical protein